MTQSGAEIIVDHLIREKVPYAFGMCGHGDIGLLDALQARRDEITTVSVQHESVAGFMADAYYRVTHAPVATFTSCGPGSANLPVALGSALMDSSAFLAITGNVATQQFNRGPFQETGRHYQADFTSVVRPYVKRSFQATRAEQLPLMLRQGFALMRQGRPGPVHLDVPLNVFVERTEASAADPGLWRTGAIMRSAPTPADVAAAVALLASAQRPVVISGHGVELSAAEDALLAFARTLRIPVAHTPLGAGTFPSDDPLALGASGRNGTYQANRALRNADVVLALGTRFDDRSTSSWLPGYTYSIPPTQLIHVDIDPAEIGRNFPPALGVVADAGAFLDAVLAAWSAAGHAPAWDAWLEAIGQWRGKWEDAIAPNRGSDARPIRPERVLAELARTFPRDGILLSDVGVHHNWVVQEWRPVRPRSVLQSWGFASMGFGLGGPLGAKLAAPERPVLAVVGDGGFLLMPSVVATAVQYDLPVVWLVWNNGGFMSIRDQQSHYFPAERNLATVFEHAKTGAPYTADYAAMSRAMGGAGEIVEDPATLGDHIAHALASGRPTVLDVRIDSQVRPMSAATWDLPPLPHPEPAFGWPDAES